MSEVGLSSLCRLSNPEDLLAPSPGAQLTVAQGEQNAQGSSGQEES